MEFGRLIYDRNVGTGKIMKDSMAEFIVRIEQIKIRTV